MGHQCAYCVRSLVTLEQENSQVKNGLSFQDKQMRRRDMPRMSDRLVGTTKIKLGVCWPYPGCN